MTATKSHAVASIAMASSMRGQKPRWAIAVLGLPRRLRIIRVFPKTRTATLAITKVLRGVVAGRVYPASTTPPSIPISMIEIFSVLVSFNGLFRTELSS